VTYIRGDHGGREARYDREEVKKLKEEVQAPVHRPAVSQEPTNGHAVPEGSNLPAVTSGIQRLIDTIEIHRAKPPVTIHDLAAKPLLTFKEAQLYTGLSEGILNEAIEAGKLKAEKIGYARRIKRSALDAYIEKNF
jgi:excisionase family DNA binding protein